MDATKIGLFFLGLVLIMAIITLFLIDAANADLPVYDKVEICGMMEKSEENCRLGVDFFRKYIYTK